MTRPPPDPDFILRGCRSPVTSLLFIAGTETKQDLLAGTQDGIIFQWNMRSQRVRQEVKAHSQSVLSMHMIRHLDQDLDLADQVLSQGREGVLILWKIDNEQWTEMKTFRYAGLGFCCIATWHRVTQNLVACPTGTQSEIKVFDPDSGQTLNTFRPLHSSNGYGMCGHLQFITNKEGEERMLVSYEDGGIVLWDFDRGLELGRILVHSEIVLHLDYSIEVNKGISVSADDTISTWCIEENKLIQLKTVNVTNPGLNCVKIRVDNRIFATGGWDNVIRIFGLKQGKPLATLSYHKDSVQCIAFDNSKSLAAGSKDTTISLWGVYK